MHAGVALRLFEVVISFKLEQHGHWRSLITVCPGIVLDDCSNCLRVHNVWVSASLSTLSLSPGVSSPADGRAVVNGPVGDTYPQACLWTSWHLSEPDISSTYQTYPKMSRLILSSVTMGFALLRLPQLDHHSAWPRVLLRIECCWTTNVAWSPVLFLINYKLAI